MGMISTANYVARRYGVRSAMPGFIGAELCRRQGAELRFVTPAARNAALTEWEVWVSLYTDTESDRFWDRTRMCNLPVEPTMCQTLSRY